jgi:hypothetical protein
MRSEAPNETNFTSLICLSRMRRSYCSTNAVAQDARIGPARSFEAREDGKARRSGHGFAQGKTTHHFLLRKDGGAIQVIANSASDKSSRDEIQMHLRHIAQAFKSGEFNIPMFVHDQTPPGVDTMTRLKDEIHYRYEAAENGGRVVVSSANADAVAAIHEFLKFQITEHKTGDALEVK